MASTDQQAFQSTFSITEIEAVAARTLLDNGKILPTPNMLSETIFEGIWSAPNFHEKSNDTTITSWPVYG